MVEIIGITTTIINVTDPWVGKIGILHLRNFCNFVLLGFRYIYFFIIAGIMFFGCGDEIENQVMGSYFIHSTKNILNRNVTEHGNYSFMRFLSNYQINYNRNHTNF